jgi:hypothetical protein
VIVKANKNFLVYCLLGVPKMLYENVKCCHLDELDAIMSSCDASFLDEISDETARLSARIVKRWWSSHSFPCVTDVYRIEPDVRISAVCCGI